MIMFPNYLSYKNIVLSNMFFLHKKCYFITYLKNYHSLPAHVVQTRVCDGLTGDSFKTEVAAE